MQPFKVLICVTGSVATVKLVELINRIKSPSSVKKDQLGMTIEIRVVMTTNSKHFVSKESLLETFEHDSTFIVFDDKDEWSSWRTISDPVLHIELRKWADLCLIAPLDANTMAKLSHGICDNLLTCLVRAWDLSKPLIYCPAMNVNMYEHPLTKQQLEILESFGYIKIDAVEKRLACGDFGMGGMAAVDTIACKVHEYLNKLQASRSGPE